MEIEFPIEFLVHGTPVSLQRKRRAAVTEWQERVKTASTTAIPAPHRASEGRIAVTLYYLPGEPMEGDIDNISFRALYLVRVEQPATGKDAVQGSIRPAGPGSIPAFCVIRHYLNPAMRCGRAVHTAPLPGIPGIARVNRRSVGFAFLFRHLRKRGLFTDLAHPERKLAVQACSDPAMLEQTRGFQTRRSLFNEPQPLLAPSDGTIPG